ncbi:hypothetical protein PC129_g3605 [Phytophthora cactorum]|uniref:Uncharacterized protein n=1 Tax=Phytophthora cactorum TaxID=29920 RepID=A0A329SLB9_9STRA|nr:hypothetical protein Pcac1_g24319 [Phytophthora cactorum]KAG2835819.1 hypothetical protein PC112_g5537 [Phytophthora cactorum]KAG2839219.1 hypothetical protein PC111_g3941 [Phytophthora cactorum]KAG2863610.1 hypothetical protein PC113_g5294 [Phytophthora cactorum]KAG2927208.1 hypothetical protein PC114_g3549 [Phytophthora cactorum]
MLPAATSRGLLLRCVARRIPPPLRTSKRAASLGATGAALAEDRKGKKKATKRASVSIAASTGRKKPEEDEGDASDLKLEDKVDPPQPKRSKKAATSTEAATAVQLPAPT